MFDDMNEIFDIRRFGKYLASEIRMVTSRFGISMLVASFFPVVLYLFVAFGSLIWGNGWSGPGIWGRFAVFCFVAFLLCIMMPASCYGHITDKKAGSAYLMIPASVFEKTVSIVLIGCVLLPAVFVLLYLATDAIVCAFADSCGHSMVYYWFNLKESLATELVGDDSVPASFVATLTNTWLYVESIISNVLIFVLGALYFKKNKAIKTIGVIFIIQTVFSFAMMPMMRSFVMDNYMDFENVFWDFMSNFSVWAHVVNCVWIVLLAVWVYFRLKTIKH